MGLGRGDDRFVAWLIRKKGSQAAAYDEAWILIVGAATVVEADALERVLRPPSLHAQELAAEFYLSPLHGLVHELTRRGHVRVEGA